MPPPRFQHEPVLVDPQIAPPYTDLAVTRIDTQPDHTNRQLAISAVIDNLGGEPPGVPFCVYITWQTYEHGEFRAAQEWRYYVNAQFPLRTPATNATLYYAEEGGDMYWVSAEVDCNQQVVDRNRANNSLALTCNPIHKPNFTADSEQPLRREVTIEKGKRKSKLTIGGKPLK
jgi:hypothetical protein